MNSSFLKISKKILSSVIFILIFFSLSPFSAAQEEQFSVDYNLDYNIDENGETTIIQIATITNLRNDVIPTSFSFSAKQLEIYDVSAETNGKVTVPKLNEENNNSTISVTIKDYAIGEGRQNKITLKYKTKSIAVKSGNIWNINIPKIQIPDTTTLYDVKLTVPKSFGSKVYVSPTPTIEKNDEKSNIFYFTKDTFQSTGISAGFGGFQPINFKIRYQIENPTILPTIKEIALPSDIKEYQNVSYEKIIPKPRKVKIDADGNLIASYFLKPKQKLEIETVGTARLYGKQINQNFGGSFEELPKKLVKNYTKEKKFWETSSPYVQSIANELKNKNENVTKNAKKIYDFIINNLTYDFEAPNKGMVERKGAEAVSSQKSSWTCMEFTDIYVATARAMGIPAREVNGYAFASDDDKKPISINLNGGDFLHSWAEFYDSFYGWVQVDPTWGTTSGIDYFTKLDTNHFSFVVKGMDSEIPYAAGTYRFSENEKLIEVALSQNSSDKNFESILEVKKVLNLNPFEILKKNMKIKVENVGNITAYEIGGKSVPPGGTVFVYVKKDIGKLSFKNFENKEYFVSISV